MIFKRLKTKKMYPNQMQERRYVNNDMFEHRVCYQTVKIPTNEEVQTLKEEIKTLKAEIEGLKKFKEQYLSYLIFLEAQSHWNEMVPHNEAFKKG